MIFPTGRRRALLRHISDPSQERAASASRKDHRHKDADSGCISPLLTRSFSLSQPQKSPLFFVAHEHHSPNISLHYRPRRWLTSCLTTAHVTGTTWVCARIRGQMWPLHNGLAKFNRLLIGLCCPCPDFRQVTCIGHTFLSL